jgi:AhpD family alkylhydroperoxidase
MSRIPPAPPEQYVPLFGEHPPLRQQIYAWNPRVAVPWVEFSTRFHAVSDLPARLLELVRLRIAFHNQCRSCMAIRYSAGAEAGVTEDLVCSLERPAEAPDLTAAEKAALGFADLFATDHLAITDATVAGLREHFSEPELVELLFQVAMFVGMGRMNAVLDLVDDLPEEYAERGTVLAPWTLAPAQRL